MYQAMNDEQVFNGTIEGGQNIDFKFKNSENSIVKIQITLPNAIAPSEVMDSVDDRILGLGLLSMKFEDASAH